MSDIHKRAAEIMVIAFDVDGVCTDGRLYYGKDGCALHAFHARDGLGLVKAREAGLALAAISGRTSENVTARLSELKIRHIKQGVWKKRPVLAEILEQEHASFDNCCYVGDDVNDLSCLTRVGLSVAPADAVDEVKSAVHVVTKAKGGRGVLREVVELILRAQGKWIVDDEPNP